MIVFDVSRLITRARQPTPTGIDRVELAYARHLIAGARRLCFASAASRGGLALLPRPLVERYVEAIAALWSEGPSIRRRARVRWAALCLRFARIGRRRALGRRLRAAAERPIYLLVSHHRLEDRRLFAALKSRHGAAFVCLIHDLIPSEFPEFARPGQGKRHRQRIENAAALADVLIVPSAATGAALAPYLARSASRGRLLTAQFGVDPPPVAATGPALPERPYFVCLGTIEARKNHLLLLNLWRDLAGDRDTAPTLLLIGRRGWEVETAIDMLDRCPALPGLVSEWAALSDSETARLLKHARALLLPSFAEGFGFPLIEALALGVPVLASDIPVFREIGEGVPEYFHPLDGAGWRAAILDYARDPSPRREAQLRRIANWRPPLWDDHFAAVDAVIAELSAAPSRG